MNPLRILLTLLIRAVLGNLRYWPELSDEELALIEEEGDKDAFG